MAPLVKNPVKRVAGWKPFITGKNQLLLQKRHPEIRGKF